MEILFETPSPRLGLITRRSTGLWAGVLLGRKAWIGESSPRYLYEEPRLRWPRLFVHRIRPDHATSARFPRNCGVSIHLTPHALVNNLCQVPLLGAFPSPARVHRARARRAPSGPFTAGTLGPGFRLVQVGQGNSCLLHANQMIPRLRLTGCNAADTAVSSRGPSSPWPCEAKGVLSRLVSNILSGGHSRTTAQNEVSLIQQ